MADRYWVGGTGTWSGGNTANWSASSGGAGGASAPTALDNVFFDANSNVGTGAFTVTMTSSPRVCNDFTASGLDRTMTLAGTSIGLTVSGSLTFQATNFTRTYTGTTTFNATTTGKTVTTNGVGFGGAVTFDGVGGAWTLGSALNCGSSTLTVTNGTFDTSSSGNYAVTAGSFASNVSSARTINLNASTITLDSITPVEFTTSTNLAFNAGTSTINLTSSSLIFNSGGRTFYNVFYSQIAGFSSINGSATYNNLTIGGRTSYGVGVGRFDFSANQTINGTLTVNASSGAPFRYLFCSNLIGTTRTLTCAAIAAMTDVDFRDITIAGAHGTLSGTRLGDCKGNSGITFPVAKTVYYRQTGSASWGATGSGSWSATSGGALDATQFPLAQDTAVFPAATYPASGSTTTINANYNIGTIDMSLRTSNTMTLDTGANALVIYGNWTNGTGITVSGTNIITFAGRTAQQITSAGRSFTQPIAIDSPSGSVTLQDSFTTDVTRTATLTSGTLDLNNFTLNTGIFSSDNSNTRSILFGTTGLIFLTATTPATTVLSMATALFFTFTGTSNISAVMSVTRTFNFGGTAGATTSNRLNINTTAGASVPTFTGSFRQINFTGSTSSIGSVSVSCHGFTLSSAGTYSSTTFLTVGSGTLTYVGKSVATLIINATGITTTLADAGQNSITTLINGTLNLAGYTLTNTTRFATTTGTKNLTFNGGTLLISGAGVTAFNNAVPTGFTTTAGTGTGVISMTASTAKTFVGGGSTFNCTLNQGGVGALTITGSNTFSNITNTVQPASVLFTAGTTSTFTNFNLSGTSGNLITIDSVTAASHTLSKASGTVSVSFCSISRSNGTGGATWEALTTNGNVDGGNNTGWIFSAVAPSTGNFLVFF